MKFTTTLEHFEKAAKHKGELRETAIRNLWQSVIDELVFRHPDPRATITCRLGRRSMYFGYESGVTGDYFGYESGVTGDDVSGEFSMSYVPDSCDPDVRMRDGFAMGWKCEGWPGRRAAELFLTAVWAFYVYHEATELVNRKAETAPADALVQSMLIRLSPTERVSHE